MTMGILRAAMAMRDVWTSHVRRRQNICDLARLSAMDDRLLQDIGVSRRQIRSAIRSGADLKPVR